MAESPGSVLDILRDNGNFRHREKHIFLSLIGRSTRLPMPVTVLADDLALRDLKERKLKISNLLDGCEDIFKINGLNFSYTQEHPQVLPLKFAHSDWFNECEEDVLREACGFEGQDIFLQSESSVLILLTGYLDVGNGCANGHHKGLRGRGIMVIGTRSYSLWRNMREESVSFPIGLFTSYVMLSAIMLIANYSLSYIQLLLTILAISLTPLALSLFINWSLLRKSRFEYSNLLFSVIAHEQGHLFGLEHVDDERSVMFQYSSSAMANFDEFSKKKLQKALRRCAEIDASLYKRTAQ